MISEKRKFDPNPKPSKPFINEKLNAVSLLNISTPKGAVYVGSAAGEVLNASNNNGYEPPGALDLEELPQP